VEGFCVLDLLLVISVTAGLLVCCQEADKLSDDDLYKFLVELKKPAYAMKKKCLPGVTCHHRYYHPHLY